MPAQVTWYAALPVAKRGDGWLGCDDIAIERATADEAIRAAKELALEPECGGFSFWAYLAFLSVNFQRCYLSFEVTDDVTEETQRDGVRRLLLHPLISSERVPEVVQQLLFVFVHRGTPR